MTLATIPTQNRLGIANCTMPNPAEFASVVLNLPTNIPIYQQQLIHSTAVAHGPTAASADWNTCGYPGNSAAEQGNASTIREISAVDTQFARRNLSAGLPGSVYNFTTHSNTYYNQIYYLGNEVDAGHVLINAANQNCGLTPCWEPVERGIDPKFGSIFTVNSIFTNGNYWEQRTINETTKICRPAPPGSGKRLKADVLAYIYLRLYKELQLLNRGHRLLVPSSADTNFDDGPYWATFFQKVHAGMSFGPQTGESGISPSAMGCLHPHAYSWPGLFPTRKVLEDTSIIKSGINWYRTQLASIYPCQNSSPCQYSSSTPLPVDVLLSEMGPLWGPQTDDPSTDFSKFANPFCGVWKGLRKGLSWWNTYLHWLTRRAGFECNLLDWATGNNALYACIHEPDYQPFVAKDVAPLTSPPSGTQAQCSPTRNKFPYRNQWYFNADSWATSVYYYAPVIDISNNVSSGNNIIVANSACPIDPGGQNYQDSFSAFGNNVQYGGSTWRRTPFGACYAAWARVGADAITGDLNTGWVVNQQAGVAATATLTLPAGYSTVYFPVIKGTSIGGWTQLQIQWIRDPGDGAICNRGYMNLDDFEDSGQQTAGSYSGYVYSAMVYPVVCWSSVARTLKVRISRNIVNAAGQEIHIGRPTVLQGACSWFITQ